MSISPDFDAFQATYDSGKPQVVWTKLVADLETPVSAYLKLADGREITERVAHPRGSPHRRMTWDELSALFRDTVADALSAERLEDVLGMVAALDRDARPKQMLARFVTAPGWVDASNAPGADWLGDCCKVG